MRDSFELAERERERDAAVGIMLWFVAADELWDRWHGVGLKLCEEDLSDACCRQTARAERDSSADKGDIESNPKARQGKASVCAAWLKGIWEAMG